MRKKMIAEIFNSSLISGPETLVLPNLNLLKEPFCIIWLREERVDADKNNKAFEYFKKFAVVHVISVTARHDIVAAAKLREKLLELKITIAHAHDVKATYILHLCGEHSNYKRISTHHGVHARSLLKVILYEQFYSRFILPKMDKTLIVCSSDLPILLSRGLSESKIIIHLNGVDRPKIDWDDRVSLQLKIRADWNIKAAPGEKIYGILARLAKEKEHKLALETFARTKDLSYKILCFGVGPEAENLKRLTVELGLQEKVVWMGYRNSVGEELAGFDGLLSFSRAEGLPISLIEAGWASTPVFSRVVDGVADLLPDNSFGYLFKKDATMDEIDSEFRKFYQDSGESRARAFQLRIQADFSGRSWAKKMDNIIESLHYSLLGKS
jgi:glycosyltransferase involved in cell wall biosynthesis